MCLNGFTQIWNLSKYIVTKSPYEESEKMISGVFVSLIITMNTLTSLPFSAYKQLVIEEKHTLNKQVNDQKILI